MKPLEWNDWVAPINLPVKGSDPKGYGMVSGWGAIGLELVGFKLPSVLHTKIVPIINRYECNLMVEMLSNMDGNDMKNSIHEEDICTGSVTDGYTVCNVSPAFMKLEFSTHASFAFP
jgi:hypothetical protein